MPRRPLKTAGSERRKPTLSKRDILAIAGSIASLLGLLFAIAQLGGRESKSTGPVAEERSQEIDRTEAPVSGDPVLDEEALAEDDGKLPAATSIEWIDLVRNLSPPEGEMFTGPTWHFLAQARSPVAWAFDGIREAPRHLKKKGYFYREGEVIITANGKFTHHILRRNLEPGSWNIQLHGPHAGVTGVTIDSSVISQELCGGIPDETFVGAMEKYRCEPNSATYGSLIYEVALPGRKKMWMKYTYSWGSRGCLPTMYFMFEEQDALTEECI